MPDAQMCSDEEFEQRVRAYFAEHPDRLHRVTEHHHCSCWRSGGWSCCGCGEDPCPG